jgi:hypothetical protein
MCPKVTNIEDFCQCPSMCPKVTNIEDFCQCHADSAERGVFDHILA